MLVLVDQVLVSRRGIAGLNPITKVVYVGGFWPTGAREFVVLNNSTYCSRWIGDLGARMLHSTLKFLVSMFSKKSRASQKRNW